MRKLVARIAFYSTLVLILLAANGAARRFYYNDVESVSDGLTNGLARHEESFLHFKRMDSSKEQCRQIYGFLPCSSNLPGHIFLIVIYEYLLYHGESYAAGDGRIFHVFDNEVAVSIFCQLLDSLPESLILLVSGLLSSNEETQEYVVTGVGLLAGSSILLLTVLWGICLICAQKPYYNVKADSRDNNNLLQGLTGSGIHVDSETCDHDVKADSRDNNNLLQGLTGSGIHVDSETCDHDVKADSRDNNNFLQRLTGSGIHVDSETCDHDVKADSRDNNNLLQRLTGSGIHVDSETCDHAKIMLFSMIPLIIILIPRAFGVSYSSQEYNFVALLSLFIALFCLCYYFYYQYKLDKDGRIYKRILDYADLERKIEMHVPYYEVQALMRKRDKHLMEKQIEMENELQHLMEKQIEKENELQHLMEKQIEKKNELQPPEDGNIKPNNIVFYIKKFNKWIDSTRSKMDDPYTDNNKAEFNQVAQLLRQDKIKVKELILKITDVNHDESSINNFFDKIDANKDSKISPLELKDFIIHKYENRPHIHDIADDLVEIFMEHLDADANGSIEEHEFKSRATRWLKVIEQYPEAENDETDEAEAKARKNGRFKAIALLLLGISMLTVLVEPLTQSVRIFSENVKIAPFYVSFILVPLATNARTAIAAIIAAKQKRHHTTSLTFSQIYHKVFMNNILGFSVLVSVIYFRGLTWHFSAEVLVLVIVCVLMGLYASFSTKFPIWTLFLVFPLYPLSLVLVYYVDDTFTFT